MKRFVFFLLFITISLTGCAKAKSSSTTVQTQEPAPVVQESVQISPEIEKLNRVLMSMSDRCKEAIPNGDPYEFLADLKKVLEIEKAFPKDDLSLYYLIDKKHTVSSSYEPTHLRKLVKNDDYIINKTTLSLREDAADALAEMGRAAKKDGITLDVSSTYRSYETQERTFNYWVSVDGLEEAERESARPGTSQHQLGAAVDFGNIEDSYALTDGCKWLNEHAEEYGWSLSFPQGYEDVTGYRWECWHFRYIGIEACKFQKKWFSDIQQFMFEFIDAWKNMD
ncbi:MAG: M15 family metallopeptidase [Treponema sp.]|nr:M15 family metallopeptidase [Treponema sp.]